MKTLIILGIALFQFNTSSAQNQSMTFAHTGITPNDTLWVVPGESIDFIYGSGGNHPMTSGQGATVSPVFFPTVTVSSTVPMETFSLTTIGTYIFHCGTNPSNTNLWGTIIVDPLNSIIEKGSPSSINVYPNPATEKITLIGLESNNGEYIISDAQGTVVLRGTVSAFETEVDISILKRGQYILSFETEGSLSSTLFIKQ